MREEANIAQWTEVTPAMFEMTLTEEMEKYDRFKDDVEEGALKQEEILEHIKVCWHAC
jgi:programmed cell death 6-interacting protein